MQYDGMTPLMYHQDFLFQLPFAKDNYNINSRNLAFFFGVIISRWKCLKEALLYVMLWRLVFLQIQVSCLTLVFYFLKNISWPDCILLFEFLGSSGVFQPSFQFPILGKKKFLLFLFFQSPCLCWLIFVLFCCDFSPRIKLFLIAIWFKRLITNWCHFGCYKC